MSRLEIIIDALARGAKVSEAIGEANKYSYEKELRKGANSELNFVTRVLEEYSHLVQSIDKTDEDGEQKGVDYVVKFNSGEEIPVQVKSSDEAVDHFRNDPRYKELHQERIVVINAASYVPKIKFFKRFSKELDRVQQKTKSTF